MVTMPASRPNAPFNVHAAKRKEDYASSKVDDKDFEDYPLESEAIENNSSRSGIENPTKSTADGSLTITSNDITVDKPYKRIRKTDELDIQHDRIVICWKNGLSNGSPVVEYEVICAKVRDYRVQDLSLARTAALDAEDSTMFTLNNEETNIPIENIHDDLDKERQELPLTIGEIRRLLWKNVTNFAGGEFLGPQAFCAKGLLPGASYIFKVRQRNAIGEFFLT